MSWISDGDEDEEPSQILWLTGPAGAGKTAIAGTIAEICEERDCLAATFFFSSFSTSIDRQRKRFLVSTLAQQIAQLDGFEEFARRLAAILERRPTLFNKRLKSQLEALILRPLRQMKMSRKPSSSRRIIILDGVDEVSAESPRPLTADELRAASEADQVEILSTMFQAASDPAFPFRILISSRPERAIQDFFSHTAGHLSRRLFLDNKYEPDSDIHLFLTSNFAEIRCRYHLPSSWPAPDVVDTLVGNASGQFIYAATIVRFLRTGSISIRERQKFIDTLLCDGGLNPFAPLDSLYARVIGSSPQPTLAIQWIWVINHQSWETQALYVRQILEDYPGQADWLLENLASLIEIPRADEINTSQYRLHHRSLIDFLEDRGRCGEEYYQAYNSSKGELYYARYKRLFESESPLFPMSRET